MRLPREEPGHACSLCKAGFPKDDDGKLPWDDDGKWNYGCPWPELEEAVETLQRYQNWKGGIHPVSTGRAPWLTAAFEEAMHFCRTVIDGR